MKKFIVVLLLFCSCSTYQYHTENKTVTMNTQDANLAWQRAYFYVYSHLGYGLVQPYHDCVIQVRVPNYFIIYPYYIFYAPRYSYPDITITREIDKNVAMIKISYSDLIKMDRKEIKNPINIKKSANPYIEQREIIEYEDIPDPAEMAAMKEFVDKISVYIKTGELK